MINYFKINDPYRLISIFILLLLVRLPFMLSGETLTVPEFSQMLLGERMAQGDVLYIEVWENTAPLASLVYAFLVYLFGRSQTAFHIVSLLLVAHQCYLFNKIMLANKAYRENTYIPGLIYGLLMCLYFDFFTLSPLLMALTFLLMCLNRVFINMEFRDKKDDGILYIGLYLGVASLFYLPVFIYCFAVLVFFFFFMGGSLRQYLLMLYGFFIPLAFLACYYFYHDALGYLYFSYLSPLFSLQKESYVNIGTIASVSAVPVLFLTLSLIRMNRHVRLTNHQSRMVGVMAVWLLFSALTLFLAPDQAPNLLQVFVPSTAFFITHYFLSFRRIWLREITFALFFISILWVNLGPFHGFSLIGKQNARTDFKDLVLRENPLSAAARGKRILVLGKGLEAYQNATPVTPYLNWKLASKVFYQLDYYDNLSHIYISLSGSKPELIIDQEGIMPSLTGKIPFLSKWYRKDGNAYYLKEVDKNGPNTVHTISN